MAMIVRVDSFHLFPFAGVSLVPGPCLCFESNPRSSVLGGVLHAAGLWGHVQFNVFFFSEGTFICLFVLFSLLFRLAFAAVQPWLKLLRLTQLLVFTKCCFTVCRCVCQMVLRCTQV